MKYFAICGVNSNPPEKNGVTSKLAVSVVFFDTREAAELKAQEWTRTLINGGHAYTGYFGEVANLTKLSIAPLEIQSTEIRL